ncbi:MAG TPA: NAD(P)-dependent alcohol dehydrogenase [Puia sp.]|nr:NAD(P)-dependent alcohol dehydrogenase [Puia sp.]
MKAVFRSKYGSAEVLSIKESGAPTPKEDEVLIRVYATTVNRTDCHILSGRPLIMRLFTGLFKPRLAATGSDFAGQIEALGKNVRSLKAGDKVMGFGGVFGCGSHSEYLLLQEKTTLKALIIMPDRITYDQVAACIEGAFYALNGVNSVKPKASQNALVIGATGAIGSATIQFLKFYDAHVTAVCKGENTELVKSLGADRVIDYTRDDFTKSTEVYDFVFDTVAKSTFYKCKPLLKKYGMYTSSGGFENLLPTLLTPILGGKKVVFRPPTDVKGSLSFIKELIEKGRFRPVIDRKYPLEKIAEAFTYVAAGQKIGNVILTMEP